MEEEEDSDDSTEGIEPEEDEVVDDQRHPYTIQNGGHAHRQPSSTDRLGRLLAEGQKMQAFAFIVLKPRRASPMSSPSPARINQVGWSLAGTDVVPVDGKIGHQTHLFFVKHQDDCMVEGLRYERFYRRRHQATIHP